jgi:hypothetical protein
MAAEAKNVRLDGPVRNRRLHSHSARCYTGSGDQAPFFPPREYLKLANGGHLKSGQRKKHSGQSCYNLLDLI